MAWTNLERLDEIMEKIEYEKAMELYEAGDDCFGRLNATGKDAVAHFATVFYGDADFDPVALMSNVELQSSRLLNPCGVHAIEFSRSGSGTTVTEHFFLDASQFDWFVRRH